MTEHYTELNIYLGLCKSDGCPEGMFEPNTFRHKDGMSIVERYLDSGWNWGLELGYDRIVESEAEAKTIIEFAEQNISGAQSLIELSHCAHGRIIFYRKIRFDGWIWPKRQELIDKLKDSGHRPKTYSLVTPDDELDRAWEKALKFF